MKMKMLFCFISIKISHNLWDSMDGRDSIFMILFSKKATKIFEVFTVDYVISVKSTVKI